MVFEKCREILLQESDLVQRIARLQEVVWEAVVNRDWTDFEGHFSELGRLGEEFTALEAEREGFFAEINGKPGDILGFYAFASQLPPDQRGEITEIYRNLKLEALKIQVSGDTLMGFIAGARTTLAGFFEIAFPDRGGKLYTPHGIPVSHDMRSMVLNRCF